MSLTEQIIAFAGTGVGSLLIGWWINKKKDDIEVTLKEQVFYKTLIEDIEHQREVEREKYEKKLDSFKREITKLKNEIHELIEQEKANKKNLDKWESYCEKLKGSLEEERKRNGLLIEEIEILNAKNK